MMKCNFLLLPILLISTVSSIHATSRRARCAVECYLKCVSSGTPKAVYCNCPVRDNISDCNSITEDLIKAKTLSSVPQVETVYKDVRTIQVRLVDPYPQAFIYIFEYSVVSIDIEQWIFAGASSTPQITFTIPDSCRDYKFRVMVVLRSNDPSNQLAVFRARAIPVQLPSFSVSQDMIHLDPPRQSNDGQSLHVFVSWQNPSGYFDSDIYGYESPVTYPIRCNVPEESLSQPRIEIVQDGARMHLNLPIDVLEEKCRIFVEVRMVPRCVRLEPFDIQASVELDCTKFHNLAYCNKELSPQCIDIMDIDSDGERAVVIWQTPGLPRKPLYYQLSYGLTQSQGAFPFITRKIVQHKEVRIPGNITRFEILAQPGVQYGVQVCAVYSERHSNNPFNIAPVTPFSCTTCATPDAPNCIKCKKIEDAENLLPVECRNQSCAANDLSTHFISMNTAKLEVTPNQHEKVFVNGNAVNPLQRHSKIISTDHALPVNVDLDETPFNINGTLDLLVGAEPTTTATSTATETTLEVSTTVSSTTELLSSTTSSVPSTTSVIAVSSSESATTTREPILGEVELMSVTTPVFNESSTAQTTLAESSKLPTRLNTDGVRLHPSKSKRPCKQRSGIVCEFGCLDNLRCECPKSEKSCIRGIHCPFVKDLRAVYENSTRTLRLFSHQISNILQNASLYDKIYLEFGEIGLSSKAANPAVGKDEFVFVSDEKERAVITLEGSNVSQLFESVPYVMSVEKPLRVGELNYGLSVCALNSSLVPVIMDNVFMEQKMFNDNSIASFTQTLLSPIDLNEESQSKLESRKSLVFVLIPVIAIFLTMLFIGALLCVNVIRDRNGTRRQKFRQRGIIGDQSGTRFTGFRSIALSGGADERRRGSGITFDPQPPPGTRFLGRTVHF